MNVSKIKRSIALLKKLEPLEGYHLAFSGGKDSICIYQLAVMAKVNFKACYALTSVDTPEMKRYFSKVIFLRPKMTKQFFRTKVEI